MIANFTDIGAQNSAFVKEYLEREGIPCLGSALGGTQARHVRFWPHLGRVQLKVVPASEAPMVKVKPRLAANGVELF